MVGRRYNKSLDRSAFSGLLIDNLRLSRLRARPVNSNVRAHRYFENTISVTWLRRCGCRPETARLLDWRLRDLSVGAWSRGTPRYFVINGNPVARYNQEPSKNLFEATGISRFVKRQTFSHCLFYHSRQPLTWHNQPIESLQKDAYAMNQDIEFGTPNHAQTTRYGHTLLSTIEVGKDIVAASYQLCWNGHCR